MVVAGVSWVVLIGIYFVFVGQASTDEAVTALCASLACAAFAWLVRRRGDRKLHFQELPLVGLLAPPLRALLADTPLVGGVLALAILRVRRAETGKWVWQEYDLDQKHPSLRAFRAIVVLGQSLSPRSFVVRSIFRGHSMQLHKLVGGTIVRKVSTHERLDAGGAHAHSCFDFAAFRCVSG